MSFTRFFLQTKAQPMYWNGWRRRPIRNLPYRT
jgi:hypothetical protein